MPAKAETQKQLQAVKAIMPDHHQTHQQALEILQTIPGIDRVAAASIPAESGPDWSVFGNARFFAAWAGLSPATPKSPASAATMPPERAPGIRAPP